MDKDKPYDMKGMCDIMNQNRAEYMSCMEVMKGIGRRVGLRFAKLLVHHPKSVLYGGAFILMLAIVCIFTIQTKLSLSAHEDHTNTKYFTTVQIESGDTLWEIAQEYISPEYASTQDYIDEVKSINHISEDDITTGCYITVPYYSESVKEY